MRFRIGHHMYVGMLKRQFVEAFLKSQKTDSEEE
jgi:hypothetical protein